MIQVEMRDDKENLERVQVLASILIDVIIQQKVRPDVATATLTTLLVAIVLGQTEDEADAWEGLRLIEQGVRMQFAEVLKRKFS